MLNCLITTRSAVIGSWKEPPSICQLSFEFQSPHVIERRSKIDTFFLATPFLIVLLSNKVKRTPQNYMNELIIELTSRFKNVIKNK